MTAEPFIANYPPDWEATRTFLVEVCSLTGKRWPIESIRIDLAFWRLDETGDRPSSRALAADWGIGKSTADRYIAELDPGRPRAGQRRRLDVEIPDVSGPLVYAVCAGDSGMVKVGYTSGPLEQRILSLATGSPYPLRVIGYWPGGLADESRFHALHLNERRNGEWFEMTDAVMASIKALSVMQ
jgi:hypothetical protein